ncbi:hypothetical protein, partial [Paraburkholderia hospita]|uniref:hypothetical protein n=1 Tax=Paraburkholderia hospita TaxID=169430 RepID=UPI001A98632F
AWRGTFGFRGLRMDSPRFWKVETSARGARVGTGAMNSHDYRGTCVTIQRQPAIENKAALSQTTT